MSCLPRRRLIAGPLLAVLSWFVLLGGCVQPPAVPPKVEPSADEIAARQAADAAAVEAAALEARVAQARQLADEAYVYGYPLLLSEMFRQQMSGAARPGGIRVPANSFWHARRLPPQAEPHPLVDQADTLDSFAWLDLGREAMLIVTPDTGRRFLGLSLHDQWTHRLAAFGTGIGDGKAVRVLLAGPEWSGPVPAGARLLRAATQHVLLTVRIQTSGSDADLRAVRALQAQLRLVPQTQRRGPGRAVAGTPEPAAVLRPGETPQQRLAALDTAASFDLLAQLLASSAPPAAADAPWLERMAELGIEPGKRFAFAALEPAVQAALADTGPRVRRRLRVYQPQLYADVGGWQLLRPADDTSADPLRRAAMAAAHWPGPPPAAQMLLLRTAVDAAGRPLNGGGDYTLRFDKGRLPPVDAVWSLTLQGDADGRHSFVPNDAARIALGTRDRLAADTDGALVLRVQDLSPGIDHAAYWLPAPKGDFVLTLRLYAPRRAPPSALPPGAGSWTPPSPQRQP